MPRFERASLDGELGVSQMHALAAVAANQRVRDHLGGSEDLLVDRARPQHTTTSRASCAFGSHSPIPTARSARTNGPHERRNARLSITGDTMWLEAHGGTMHGTLMRQFFDRFKSPMARPPGSRPSPLRRPDATGAARPHRTRSTPPPPCRRSTTSRARTRAPEVRTAPTRSSGSQSRSRHSSERSFSGSAHPTPQTGETGQVRTTEMVEITCPESIRLMSWEPQPDRGERRSDIRSRAEGTRDRSRQCERAARSP